MIPLLGRLFVVMLTAVPAAAFLATPATAYRVFLDHDTDNDLTTFTNEVVGPLSAPITFVVEFDSLDAGISTILFTLEWDCEEDGCKYTTPHGSILDDWQLPPSSGPFSNIEEHTCLMFICQCEAGRWYTAAVSSPLQLGYHPFGTQEFSRIGVDYDCEDMAYPYVEFRIDCFDCNYQPGDESRTRMRIRTMSTAVPPTTWGRIKAVYR
jgi:hypothetical protein